MNRIKTFILIPLAFISYMILSSSSLGQATAHNSGNTGAPGESITCMSCHASGAFGTVSLNIALTDPLTAAPVSAYTPGEIYNLVVTMNHTSGTPTGYGFQLTALTTFGNNPIDGYSNLATNVQQATLSTGRTYVEQHGTSNSNVFTMDWTAPGSGTGSITFYAGGNCVNDDGSNSGDGATRNSLIIPEFVITPISLNLDSQYNPICFGDSNGILSISTLGGIPPYTFDWADVPGTNNTEDRTGLSAGTYSLMVIDSLNSNVTGSYTISQPTELIVTSNSPFPICNGDAVLVSLSATGGLGNYQYDFGAGLGPLDTASFLAGDYTFYAVDANLCQDSTNYTITEPSPLNASAMISGDPANGDGSIDLTVSGGMAPYTFTWSNGESSEDIQALDTSDTLWVIITDDAGCSDTLSSISFPISTNITDLFGDKLNLKIMSNELFIENLSGQIVALNIMNIHGQLVLQEYVNTIKSISLASFSPGIYFYVLRNEKLDKTYTGKMMIK